MRNIRIEFLLEEPSMENFLRIILPQILPDDLSLDVNCYLRPHNGKSDLLKSIPNKVQVFSNFHIPAKLVIVHDQDTSDCIALKAQIQELVNIGNPCDVLIRIPCRELEAWYLGDMDSIKYIYNRFKPENHKNKAKFRNPDILMASDEMKKLCPEFQKGYASKNIPLHMNIDINKSASFNNFISGLNNFLN
jgi:hypothetical protein